MQPGCKEIRGYQLHFDRIERRTDIPWTVDLPTNYRKGHKNIFSASVSR